MARDQFRLPEPNHYAGIVDGTVGTAHASAEVGLELGDRKRVWDQRKGGGGWEAGSMLGKKLQGRPQILGQRRWRGEIEREEGMIDGRL